MNDALRAAVFARDKGICSFSGLSVWFLDHGTAPFSHADWVDHVVPKSRNGKDSLENLVCASYFYNRKKLNNGSDRQYLFSEGRPTETFLWRHGELTAQQAKLLKQHATLQESDWYFNRAMFNVAVAIGDELTNAKVIRTRAYWLTAAKRRMQTWRRKTDGRVDTFAKRGLVRFPQSPDVGLMLSLASAPESNWGKIYGQLLKLTRSNEKVYSRFLNAVDRPTRLEVVREAEVRNTATLPLLDVMKKNLRYL